MHLKFLIHKSMQNVSNFILFGKLNIGGNIGGKVVLVKRGVYFMHKNQIQTCFKAPWWFSFLFFIQIIGMMKFNWVTKTMRKIIALEVG